ncbi:RNA 2',3'-cyclic phosphodiesterase [Patescibacteria group bacterium]|nr:RNA 2',3'-cyclic phosphodiesterase [Patescibacteria group bacterium]MBU1682941.1 RNA 2',3'-cyclic phosphodiesterase [Patescibacteria group bacterium]
MRLFISIDVPKEFHRYCQQLQDQFPDIRKTNEFHLTLQFLGDDIEDAEPIIETLKTIKFEQFELEMGDALPFPNPFQPRGIWIECKKTDALEKLANDIREALEPLGFIPDKPFKAHITLGRFRKPPHKKPEKIEGEQHKFTVNHFNLMESMLSPIGPKYKRIIKINY